MRGLRGLLEDVLRCLLTSGELRAFSEVYELSEAGNFEGKNHLQKKTEGSLPVIEATLLAARRKRPQPFVDRKIVTSWNALAGCALASHWRATGDARSLQRACDIFWLLLECHRKGGHLIHSMLDGKGEARAFLEDDAAMHSRPHLRSSHAFGHGAGRARPHAGRDDPRYVRRGAHGLRPPSRAGLREHGRALLARPRA